MWVCGCVGARARARVIRLVELVGEWVDGWMGVRAVWVCMCVLAGCLPSEWRGGERVRVRVRVCV